MTTTLALAIALTTLSPAHAAADSDPDWELACRKRCERDGFTIEVLSHTSQTASMVRFWNGTEVMYADASSAQSGDLLLGYQSAGTPLAGGPYCESVPGAGGHFIVGAVYERTQPASWSYEETGTLHTDPSTYCGASMDFLLDVLDLYGLGHDPLPDSCSDIGCASGGGSGGSAGHGGSGTWEYTDASGETQSFDDLWDDGDDDDDDDGDDDGVVSVGAVHEAESTRAEARTPSRSARR